MQGGHEVQEAPRSPDVNLLRVGLTLDQLRTARRGEGDMVPPSTLTLHPHTLTLTLTLTSSSLIPTHPHPHTLNLNLTSSHPLPTYHTSSSSPTHPHPRTLTPLSSHPHTLILTPSHPRTLSLTPSTSPPVGHGPHHRVHHAHLPLLLLGQAKVSDAEAEVSSHHDIGGRQVAVNNVLLLVNVAKCKDQLGLG